MNELKIIVCIIQHEKRTFLPIAIFIFLSVKIFSKSDKKNELFKMTEHVKKI